LEVIKNILIHHSNKVKIKGGVIYNSKKWRKDSSTRICRLASKHLQSTS